MSPKRISQFMPGRIILVALLATISLGTLLLLLPASHNQPIALLDLIFTATSVTCVTGLLTVPLSSFTLFGQSIILIFMQVGGLGLITMTIFTMSIFVQLGLTTQLLVGKMLELESWQNIRDLLFFITKFTFFIELIGALFIFSVLQETTSLPFAIFCSIFHAISSFCNAGFSLLPNPLPFYNHNITMLTTTSLLMIFGGLGFITWHELFDYSINFFRKKRVFLSLYSKIILSTTVTLLLTTSVLFFLLEYNHTFASMNGPVILLNVLFNAISVRSCGFVTVNPLELQTATLFIIMIIAFIGSSPGSTGSGIKTTTFAIFLATIKTAILGRNSVQIKRRRIARDQVYKALAIISLSLAWIIVTTFCLLITEKSSDFFDILFEVISAFATLGISTGITPNLSDIGKVMIIATMIIGRIGSLTVILALRKKRETQEYEYPEERVMLG